MARPKSTAHKNLAARPGYGASRPRKAPYENAGIEKRPVPKSGKEFATLSYESQPFKIPKESDDYAECSGFVTASIESIIAGAIAVGRNKILINTSKVTYEHADAYIKYVLSAVKGKPLFQWIEVRIA